MPPEDLTFTGYIQPAGTPPDPTGESWRGIQGATGETGPAGDASLASIIATGSTTARSAADRFSDSVNIKDFGGVADYNQGTGLGTDNTGAFVLASATGKNIRFPMGWYFFASSPPAITSKMILEGDGREQTYVVFGPLASHGFVGNFADFRNPSGVFGMSILCQGQETGSAIKVSYTDADAVLIPWAARLVIRDVAIRGTNITNSGWAKGVDLLNVQMMNIDNISIYGRMTSSPTVPAHFTHMTDGIYITNGAYDIGMGYIRAANIQHSLNGIRAQSASLMEALSIADSNFVSVGNGIVDNLVVDGPGLSVNNCHMNVFFTGVSGTHVPDSVIANLLIYKHTLATTETIGVLLTNSSYSTVTGVYLKNQTATFGASGGCVGVRLVNSGYCKLSGLTAERPTFGVDISGALSVSNFGVGVDIVGSFSGGSTTALRDTSGQVNTINSSIALGTETARALAAEALLAPKISPVFTTPTTGNGVGAASLKINGAAGSSRYVEFQTAGSTRWLLETNGTAESGGHVGSDFRLISYTDAGAIIAVVVTINRLSGLVTLSKGAVISGGASTIDGASIGAATPGAGAFTTLAASGLVSGAGHTAWAASPPPIGSVAPGTGAFTTLSATSTISGAGFTAWAASPPPIGSTVANTGAFTTLTTTSLSATSPAFTQNIIINGAVSTSRSAFFRSGNVNRWTVYTDNATESGSNVGSDFTIGNYSDAGSYLSDAFIIKRSTGLTTMTSAKVSGAFVVDGAVSGAGFTAWAASPPAIGATAAAAGAFTTLFLTGNFAIGATNSASFNMDKASAVSFRLARGGTLGTLFGIDDGSSLITGAAAGDTVIRATAALWFAAGGANERGFIDVNGSGALGRASLSTAATDGFFYIPSCAGVPTGVPTAKTGRVPLVADSTNNKIYSYLGGAWVALN